MLYCDEVCVRGMTYSSTYILLPSLGSRLNHYQQMDFHSCGFIAALTALTAGNRDVNRRELLLAVRPTAGNGLDAAGLADTLGRFGMPSTTILSPSARRLLRLEAAGAVVVVGIRTRFGNPHWAIIGQSCGDAVRLFNAGWLDVFRWCPVDELEAILLGEAIACW